MPTVFPRPALPTLIQRLVAQLQANLPGLDPVLRRNVAQVVGTVVGQELMNEYAYLDFMATNFFVSSAQGIYLDRRGNELGVYRSQAVAAAGPVIFTGTNGYTVPANATLQAANNGPTYVLAGAVTIVGGTATGSVTALAGGTASNQDAGAPLTLSVAIAGINAQATVGGEGLTGGIDLQSDAAYRTAILARMQQPPQGGAARDYATWIKAGLAGVTRAWVYPLNRGAGTVDWAFVLDGQAPGSILPNGTQVAAVTASVLANYPVDVGSSEYATLTADSINVTLTNLTTTAGYTLAQAEANITTSLQNLFASTTPGGAPFGDGVQPGGTGGTLLLEMVSDAITQSEGVAGFDLTAPSADIVSATYHLAQFGTLAAS